MTRKENKKEYAYLAEKRANRFEFALVDQQGSFPSRDPILDGFDRISLEERTSESILGAKESILTKNRKPFSICNFGIMLGYLGNTVMYSWRGGYRDGLVEFWIDLRGLGFGTRSSI